MKSLTGKQSEIYDFIWAYQKTNGFPPSQEEIRTHFRLSSTNAVRSHLVLIEKKGYININSGKARGIKLMAPAKELINHKGESIPLLGNIAAGAPIWAEQNIEEYLPLSSSLFGGGTLFAVHVFGDSMSGIGINNGDIAIIQSQDLVENGEIAAVLIEQEATLKRVYVSSEKLVLKAENPAFNDLVYAAEEYECIRILGLYKGIVRTVKSRSYAS